MRRKNSSQARERRRYFFHTRYEAMLQGSRHHAETSLYPLRSVELELILGMMHLYSSYIW